MGVPMDWKTDDPKKQAKRFRALALCGVVAGTMMGKQLFPLIYHLLGLPWPGEGA